MLKKLKENSNKQFTTDSNGNILLIRGTGIDKLQGEFFMPKLNILEKETIPASNENNNNNSGKQENKDTAISRMASSKSKKYQKLPVPKSFGFLENANISSSNVANFIGNMNNNLMNTYNNGKNADADKMASILPAGSSFEYIFVLSIN